MARGLNKLTDRTVQDRVPSRTAWRRRRPRSAGFAERQPIMGFHVEGGRQADGDGLGAYPAVGLADAREKAAACRKLVAAGSTRSTESRKEAAPTFRDAVDRFLDDQRLAAGGTQAPRPVADDARPGVLQGNLLDRKSTRSAQPRSSRC